ncbi:MAG: TolC family protein [Bdellovibrionota bacterium]
MRDSTQGKKFRTLPIICALLFITMGAGPTKKTTRKISSNSNITLLTLNAAIKKALDNNYTIQSQRLTLRLAELTHDRSWNTMFMPSVSLNLNAPSNYTVANIPSKISRDTGDINNNHGYPASTLTLSLASYTLFNFWRDWLTYEQAQLDWLRAKEAFHESTRTVRFDVIKQFFAHKTALDRLETAKRSVDIAEAIVELIKSRVKLKKATEQDLSSSTVDLLNARNELAKKEISAKGSLWTLNYLLGDPVGQEYMIEEKIVFTPLKLTSQEAVKIYSESSPSIKTAKTDLKKKELAVELAEKNRLPLPKVSFSGINISYSNGYYGTRSDINSGSSGNVNLDVSTAITLTLPIIGPGGLFDKNTIEQAVVERDQSEVSYRDTLSRDHAVVNQLVFTIKEGESTISNTKKAMESSVSLLDELFSQLSSNSVPRLELKDAIKQARESEIDLAEAILNHLTNKLTLAQTIGMDQIPGDPY